MRGRALHRTHRDSTVRLYRNVRRSKCESIDRLSRLAVRLRVALVEQEAEVDHPAEEHAWRATVRT